MRSKVRFLARVAGDRLLGRLLIRPVWFISYRDRRDLGSPLPEVGGEEIENERGSG